jgi:hypothetical protein
VGIRNQLLSQGYFEVPPVLPADLVARVRDDVARAGEDAFLEDAMWDLLDLVVPIAREALDSDVAILPAFWAWCLAPNVPGWPPHRDNLERAYDADGGLASVTLWVPLTDATAKNGCMYCVPAYWDIAYRSRVYNNVVLAEDAVRALPVPAGSVLGWSQALLHWGGRCGPDEAPRISTSFEMIRADLVSMVPRTYPPTWRPPASERRAIVDEMRVQYAHMLSD